MDVTARAPRSFSRQMRVRKAQEDATMMKNYQMGIMLGQLSDQVKNLSHANRRISAARPKTEEFYSFDEDDVGKKPHISSTTPYNFNNPVSTSNVSTAFSRSPNENDDYNWRQAPDNQHRTLSDRFIESELNRVNEEKEILEKQLTDALDNAARWESTVLSLKNQNTEVQKELARERAIVENTRKSQAALELSQKNDEERQRLQKIEQDRRVSAEQRASIAEEKAKELAVQRDLAMQALDDEKRRVAEWEEARRKSIGVSRTTLSNETVAMLLGEMQRELKCLQTREYSADWRKYALKNWNLCLRVLQLCEMDVLHERRIFIMSSCTGPEQRLSYPEATKCQ